MPELLSEYELLKCIGTGGMAEVHLARHRKATPDEPHVVVKRLLPNLAKKQEYVRMFIDEARIGMRMKHPNIVATHGWGITGGLPFMVMEMVDGPQLGTVVNHLAGRGKKLPIPVAVGVVAKAAQGLHHAHGVTDDMGRALHVVHRDVSPQNIMMTRGGDVKVVDFGVAKTRTQSTITQAGVLKGKVGYASPEQCACKPLDRRSDVWALGVVMHELLTGQRLFAGDHPLEVMQRIIRGVIPPPSSVASSVPRDLDVVVMAALAQRVDERTPDALALAGMLEDFLNNFGTPMEPPQLASWLKAEMPELLGDAAMGFAETPAPAASVKSDAEAMTLEEKRQGFYARLFGELPILGAERIFVTPELATAEKNDPRGRKISGQWLPFFVVSDVEPVLQRVGHVGGRVVQPLTRAENGWFAIVEDDTANLVGVFSHVAA